MTELYKRVELIEGTPIQFVGVHALEWRLEWGRPEIGFVEAEQEDIKSAINDTEDKEV